ncbi:MAG TPA: TonB-dependent receptor [Caulobacteraceae bacterium]|nr:TonB-dependent receptor [Caulobacteraceae bacterium]
MTYGGKSYQAWLLGGAAAVAMMHGGAAAAQDTRFDIAPQPLASALNEFSVQSRQSVLFTTDLANAKSSPGVSGEVEVADALSSILAGTGLTWKRQGETFLVMRVDDPQGGSAAGGGAEVEALIVTAQKREEDIQDVPIAISAFTQEDLTRSQIAGGPDLITQIPNFTFTKTNFSSYSIQIRGIGTQAISATTDPAVAVAFNNTPFVRNRFFEQEFYDLQRVEVLRGPQGTLYGRNATAGVVNIISAKPKFIYEAKASADVSNYNSTRIEGMVNIPLVEDAVAIRAAGAWTKRDGYATNELTGNPIDGRDLWSTRLSLRVAPPDSGFDMNLIWEHFEEDDDRLRSGKQLCHKDFVTDVGGIPTGENTPLPNVAQGLPFTQVQGTLSQGCRRGSLYSPDAFQTPNGRMLPYYSPLDAIGLPVAFTNPYVGATQSSDLRVIESTVDPEYRAEADIAELQISFDLSDTLTLASETAYSTDEVFSLQDFNRFNTRPGAWEVGGRQTASGSISQDGVFCDPQLGCSDRLVLVDLSTAESRQFSQEFRLSSDFDGPFNFSLGGNFLRYDTEDKYYVFINSTTLYSFNFNSRSGGVFDGTVDYHWVPGVSDNADCLANGRLSGDPNVTYNVTECIYIDPNPIGSLNDQGHNYFLSKNPYKLISYAAFGEAYYNVTENLKVTGGLRWTVDKKYAPRIPTQLLVSESFGYPVAEVIEQEWREPTGRLAIDWKPDLGFTDETLLYASYAHGYKAGGANPPGFVRAQYGASALGVILNQQSATRPKVFDAEFVDAFELGAKNTLLDGRLTMNLAAFYYDYKDYQISEIVERSAFNRNFDAEVWGLEIESDWRPLENLKLGFKGGYQMTRIGDGERAIDLMDRTAGREDWLVVRPFPTQASSCVLPTALFTHRGTLSGVELTGLNPNGQLWGLGGPGGGNPGGCEIAYLMGRDPVTYRPYTPYPGPTPSAPGQQELQTLNTWPTGTYPGWNPLDESQGHNFGEGFFKDLSGNELPNAPNWTATITADYTVPLPNEWLMNLHTDVHWQAESWWRVFNDHEYSKLDEFYLVNLAAIFTNEDAGWNIMAYVKNVLDEDALTGAFLLSDDTALVTNVFLTEPRLYGLRVTKAWSGGPLLGSFEQRPDGPYPFTVELGGQIQRHDAPNEPLAPSFIDEFSGNLDPLPDQQDDLDWGDGREMRLIYRPGGEWTASLAARFGRTNGSAPWSTRREEADRFCPTTFGQPVTTALCDAGVPGDGNNDWEVRDNYSLANTTEHEDHTIIDFMVGKNVGLGALEESTVSAGLRYGDFGSATSAHVTGQANWNIVPEAANFIKYLTPNTTFDQYEGELSARREFKGVGPVLSWEASKALLGGPDRGALGLDWSLTGGVLFGDRETTVEIGEETAQHWAMVPARLLTQIPPPASVVTTPATTVTRSESVTVPTYGASLGLSYAIGGFKIGTGYRWERYAGAIDGGFMEAEDADRTIDGPYFKLSVGFGG